MSIRFQKLIFLRFAILALLAGFSLFVRADIPYSTTYAYEPYNSTRYPTVDAACQSLPAGVLPAGVTYVDYAGVTCYFSNGGGSNVTAYTNSCPVGYTDTGSACASSPCANGAQRDPATGECTVQPTCPSGQIAFTTTLAGGGIDHTSCVPVMAPPPNAPNCTINWANAQASACQQQSNECTSTGGTPGTINGQSVCIPPTAPNRPPVCASGPTQFSTNPDGSSSVTCTAPYTNTADLSGHNVSPGNNTPSTPQAQSAADTANNTAAIAKINNEGFQGVVNAINNISKAGGGGAGNGSSASQDQSNTAGIIQAINDFKNQEKGAGQCDPKKSDYTQCIQQTETAPDADGSTTRSAAITAGNAKIDAAGQTVVDGINATSQQGAPSETSSFKDTFLSYLPQTETCSDWSTSIRGVQFSIHCTETSTFRNWAAWVLALLTMWAIFEIMFRRPQ